MLETPATVSGKKDACGCSCGGADAPASLLPVAAAAVVLLDQCASFIGGVAGRPACYAGDSGVLRGGTIGKHVRHTLDHFRAALDGLRPGAVVDYDRRERDVPMETDPGAALDAIARVRDRLSRLAGSDLERPLRIRVMLTGDGQEAVLTSTLGRELAFAAHHAVHHHAMIAAIAREFGVETCADFGKAPSTLKHERAKA
jgi:uncharacterized damage-inducible protein DinB